MIHQNLKEVSQVAKSEFELIKGEFTPEEALEIINHLIVKKIHFHRMKSFSNEIRFGEVDSHSLQRTKELKLAKKSVKELIDYAQSEGKSLKISSNISIDLI
uniref:hypothetical protein n=1 Tax=Roseivirga sp. TaxID=1964215 RepID=UPI004047C35D